MSWLLARLKERSTWLAMFTFAGLLGMKLDPELRELIINAILGVAAVAAFVWREHRDPNERTRETDLPPIDLQGRSAADPVPADDWMHIVVPPRPRIAEHDERGLPPDHPGWGG